MQTLQFLTLRKIIKDNEEFSEEDLKNIPPLIIKTLIWENYSLWDILWSYSYSYDPPMWPIIQGYKSFIRRTNLKYLCTIKRTLLEIFDPEKPGSNEYRHLSIGGQRDDVGLKIIYRYYPKLETLSMYASNTQEVVDIAESENLANLEVLTVQATNKNVAFDSLCSPKSINKIQHLDLRNVNAGFLEVFSNCEVYSNLAVFILHSSPINNNDIKIFCSGVIKRLRSLFFGFCEINDESVKYITQSSNFRYLEELTIRISEVSQYLTQMSMEYIMNSRENLPRLKKLNINLRAPHHDADQFCHFCRLHDIDVTGSTFSFL